MKRNWKRLLAAVVAFTMLLGDSAFVYATEVSQQIEEISSEEPVLEEPAAEEPIVEEMVVEAPAEEAAEEESVLEEDSVAEEETAAEEELTAEGDPVATIKMELADTILQLNYDVTEETWGETTSHIILKTDVEGFVIDEDYYSDYWANFNSLEIVLYKDGEVVEQFVNSYDFTVSEAGDYTLEATYAHSETEKITLTADFSVINGPRPYPVNDTIVWNGITNFNPDLTFEDIKADVKELLNRDIQDRLLEGENICTEGSVSFKTTTGTAVKDTTEIKSGNYIAVYTLGDDSGKFYAEAESLLKIRYEKMTSAGVDYSLVLEEEASLGKLAEAGVAYPIDGVNDAPYGSAVKITPKFNTPWGELTAGELKEYGITATVTATVKENKKLLNVESNDDSVVVTASGSGYGTAAISIAANFSDEAGNSLGKAISTSISKFTVAAGDSTAVKELYVGLKESEGETVLSPVYTTDEIDTYLVEKSSTARKYLLDVAATGFTDEEITPKLTWKTSNSKIAQISKDGKKITIPKNAQGVVDITATVKDSVKQSVTFKLVVVDLNVRMDSAKITADSTSAYPIITNIYPNLMAAKLKEGIAEVSISIIGKSADIFEMDYYDPETGEFAFCFINPNQKKGTYSLKLEIVQKLNEMEYVSTTKEIKVTNKTATPKPTAKIVKKYNKALAGEDAYAEVLVNAKGYVDTYAENMGIRLKNGIDLEIKDIYPAEKNNQWYVKIGTIGDEQPTKKSYKDSLIITYEDYRMESSVSVNIPVENKRPTMKVYGNEVYKPQIYTDLGLNTLDVLIDVPDNMVELDAEGYVDNNTLYIGDATSVVLTPNAAKSFEIIDGHYAEYGWTTDSKGNDVLLEGVLVVKVKANKNGTLQFKVSDSDYYSGTVTTKQLAVTAKKISAEAVKLYKSDSTSTIKSFTFSQNMLGKEIMTVHVQLSDALSQYIKETPGLAYEIRVESTDAVATAVQGDYVKIIAKEKGFESKSSKIKISAVLKNEGTEIAQIKGSTITVKFVKSIEPKVTLSSKGSIVTTVIDSVATVKAQLKNMPAGSKIAGIKFTKAADARKFILWDTEDINSNKGTFTIGKKASASVPIGKNKIGITYRIRTMGGEVIEVPTTVTVTVAEKVKLKASKSSITLYNSVLGGNYGKTVEFSDTLNNADIKSVEFVTDLKKLGISYEQVSEYDNSTFVFYTDEELNRAKEKTYTVKAKITLKNAGTKKGEPVAYTVNFKINLKK